jgi:hypothetical protein
MVLLWVSVWMLAAPLFHVHPEADHRHGEVGHVHGGTVHTVWSPDLDCEFDNHEDTVGGLAQFAHSGGGHTELGLSLLTDSTDRKSLKPIGSLALVGEAVEDLEPAPASFGAPHRESSPYHRFIASNILTRAPPTPSV